ncbi:MAG TPA: ATP-binding protein, partial [Dongiaceae bacterium]|nr:ATP-binding protein [Dongiaceae bacterium]
LISEDIKLTFVPDNDAGHILMDPSQIDQILVNLVVNARDAIEGRGDITITTANAVLDNRYCQSHRGASPGSYVRLCVCDTGSGMDAATLNRIFEPFFTTKELGKGTGLGLATVYGIVKQNNGEIHAESQPGNGCTFVIHIPRQTPASVERPLESPPLFPVEVKPYCWSRTMHRIWKLPDCCWRSAATALSAAHLRPRLARSSSSMPAKSRCC